ncbi:hypothetical protein CHUAL_010954 [Chamberlinius hualienensis]
MLLLYQKKKKEEERKWSFVSEKRPFLLFFSSFILSFWVPIVFRRKLSHHVTLIKDDVGHAGDNRKYNTVAIRADMYNATPFNPSTNHPSAQVYNMYVTVTAKKSITPTRNATNAAILTR